jgi:hypothetical protein
MRYVLSPKPFSSRWGGQPRRSFRVIQDRTDLQNTKDQPMEHLGEPASPPEVVLAHGPPLWNQAAEPVPDWADSPTPAVGIEMQRAQR